MANMWHSLVLILLTVSCSLVSSGNITISLHRGVCLRINEPNTKAVSDPANPSTTIAQLRNGDCFTTNGGLYHSGDVTWYELKDDRNGLTAWVDSFYLEIVSSTKCSSGHASSQSNHTSSGSPLHCEAFGQQFKCNAVVHTSLGDIAGNTETIIADGTRKVITQFTNIPYAESTGGQNRFLKPIPKAHFNDTFYAIGNPVGCIQSSKEATRQLSPYVNFTEDCLILNIFVPHDFTQNVSLPVMIWIHGGAFVGGASSEYAPGVLTALSDVIVVTINYRLGMFGFLQSRNGKLQGNQGLWDQHLAIKWIHENIIPFTGDPNKVTIFGESAGSASVLYQAMYPGNRGYFHRVIAESGSPLADWALLHEPNADAFYKYAGCDVSSNPEVCLRAKTIDQLQVDDSATSPLQFVPAIDGEFIPESAHTILYSRTRNTKSIAARAYYNSLDILSGVNNFDGALYMTGVWPYRIQNAANLNNPQITRNELENIVFEGIVSLMLQAKDNDTKQLLKQLVTFEYTDWSNPDSVESTRESTLNISCDVGFFYPAISAAQVHASSGEGKTYFYEFIHAPAVHAITMPSWIHGANHADELDYVFGKPLLNTNQYSNEDKYVARVMTTMWTNFAKSGNPNIPRDISVYVGTAWPEYNLISQKYLQISSNMSSPVKQRFYAKRMEFWSTLIPKFSM
ncbi:Carboxylesterase 5A [Mactra antiquata]